MFNEEKFNWKEAIYQIRDDVVTVKADLGHHLDNHRFWKKFWGGLIIAVVGATVSTFWICVSNGLFHKAVASILLNGGK